MNASKAIPVIIAAAGLAACAGTPPRDPEFAATRPQPVEVPAVANGAIYQAGQNSGWFGDVRAKHIGDVLTVVLTEATNATKAASTNAAKEADTTITAPTLFGAPVTRNGRAFMGAQLSSDQDFAGSGDSAQSNTLTGRITVTVAEVLANGYLLVRGEKIMTLNQGDEYVRFSGIVRPSDIRADNTVLSTQVADARIVYGGEGVLADANRPGWLTRFFMKIWPF